MDTQTSKKPFVAQFGTFGEKDERVASSQSLSVRRQRAIAEFRALVKIYGRTVRLIDPKGKVVEC